MTGAWAVAASAALAISRQGAKPVDVPLDEQIHILGRVKIVANGDWELSDGVTIFYGPTKMTAERVVANPRTKTGRAFGNVVIEDPEGSVQATDVTLSWAEGTRRATAEDVRIEVAGARLFAKHADLTDSLWVFSDVEGTTCRRDQPIYSIRAPRFEVVPGKSGKVVRPRISLFGKQILTLPDQRFNLDPRVQGIRIPTVAYRRNQGFGIAWNGQVLLNAQTAAGFDFGAFRGGYPTFSLGASRSFVPATRSSAPLTPRDDLADRFNYGYFDTIELDGPNAATSMLSQKRSTLALQSQFNRGASIGPPELSYSKPVELVYEGGGKQGSFSGIGQLRAQSIRTQYSSIVHRVSAGGTAVTDLLPLGERVGALATLDAQGWTGDHAYGWGRASAGLVYQPLENLSLGAAGFWGQEFGKSDFPADQLYAKTGYALRADLKFGGFRGRYMVKYDTRLKWFDREYSVNQVVGCLEAYLLYRQYPQTDQVGVTLRVDQFVSLLQRRRFERTQPTERSIVKGQP